MAEHFDVVVIGAGPGGFRAARRCAQRGASVAAIEKEYVGGTCLNWGCIPLKVLLASAHTLLAAKQAGQLGIDIPTVTCNLQKIHERKDAIITAFRKGMTATAQANKMNLMQGRAFAVAANKIKVETNGSTSELQTDRLILAPGSVPVELPAIPFDGQTVISSKEALSLPEIPESMVIIGGGIIGCEMACFYSAMGAKITIVEALSQLLPMEDEWVGRLIEREFRKLNIDSITGRKVTSVDKTTSPARITLEDSQILEAQKVLVSVGRKPFVDAETADALKLRMNGPAIVVNDKFETSVPGVYAVGDVIATTFLAHGATTEAEVVAVNATGGDQTMSDYHLIPKVIFTFPEVASVGKSEKLCEEEGLDVTVGKAFFKANGRAVAHNMLAGQVRVIRDNATNNIVGVTMVGDMATEFVALARTLIGKPYKPGEITFPHPTISETIEEAAENAMGKALLD